MGAQLLACARRYDRPERAPMTPSGDRAEAWPFVWSGRVPERRVPGTCAVVARLRGYGDEVWRLARQRDVAALRRASALLLEGDAGEHDYDGHRARAFAFAVDGRSDDALAELNKGWTEDWPFPAAYAADTARVWYLAGDYERALGALELAMHGADRLDPAVADLVRLIVAKAPRLRLRAVRVALGGGTPWQRLRNATAAATGR
jgi:hypothetical protein